MKTNTVKYIIGLLLLVAAIAILSVMIGLHFANRPEEVSWTHIQANLHNVEWANVANDRIDVRWRSSTRTNPNLPDAFAFGRFVGTADLQAALDAFNEEQRELIRADIIRREDETDVIRNTEEARIKRSIFGYDGLGKTELGEDIKEGLEEEVTTQLRHEYRHLLVLGAEGNIVDYTARDAAVNAALPARLDIRFYQEVSFMIDSAFDEAFATAIRLAISQAEADGFTIRIYNNNRFAPSIFDFIFPVGGIILLIIVGFFIFRMMSKQEKSTTGFQKSKANAQKDIKVRFGDVAGAEEEKVELQEIVEFLKAPDKFTKVGAKIPRGVLLVGPPGTGKTLFAKAVAGEADVPFFSISGSDFVEMFVGVGASRVRDLFDQAKRSTPCIIFIDEIDAVGRQRGAGLGGGHDEREQTLNQLLVQMDGFETNEGIIVMAATNRADILDPALLRPGRFDRQVYVHIPDVRGREAIFKVHARNKPMAPDVDFQILARLTSGFTGADIANLLNEAAILCARDNRTQINMNDLNEGIDKVLIGPQKKSRLVSEVDRRITAYHEVGHAIVGKITKKCGPVHEVSIIPRGAAGGYTVSRPDNDDRYESVAKMEDHLARIMGGRAAEEIVIQDITSGASGDIKMATEIAHKMVTEWGMSGNKKLGQVFYGSSQEVFLGRDYGSSHRHSEATAAEIDKEVSRIIEDAYQRALKILKEHRKEMDVMARVLLECETIYTEEVDMIMEGKSFEEVRDALNARMKKRAEKVEKAFAPATA